MKDKQSLALDFASVLERIPIEVVKGFSMKMMRFPSFFKPENVYNPFHQPDLQKATEEGIQLGKELTRTAAQQEADGEKRILVMIDDQNDFMDYYRFLIELFKMLALKLYGRLPVNGALDDVFRLCLRIIRSVYEEYYSAFIVTYDWHPDHVIHGSTWWRNVDFGSMPDVTLPVQMELADEKKGLYLCKNLDGSDQGLFKAVFEKDWTVKYAEHLRTTGQGNIWVFTAHCGQGTDGAMLHPVLQEVITWACAARMIRRSNLFKGHIAKVDWFGPFMPCMEVPGHGQGSTQVEYLDQFENAKTIDIAGEADDFCVFFGKKQSMDYHADRPDVLRSMRFIKDCSSPIVPNSPHVAALNKKAVESGIRLITHDTF